MPRYLVIGLAAVLGLASALVAGFAGTDRAGAASACQFQKSTSTVAFCDTFDGPAASNASRSGALDPAVWGVSEISALDNPAQSMDDEFVPATSNVCGGGSVLPPANIQICNGHLFDTVNDGGSQTVVAMYPRQPFDIAGRTGDVTFDVANDTLGSHAAWPTFVYTDQPVPAPYTSASGINSYARNSFGFTMEGTNGLCPSGQWTVGSMFVTRNHALDQIGSFAHDGCVSESSNPSVMSHVEVQISVSQVTVWASDAGTSNLVKIAELDGANLPLTRGLVWVEDAHYNADKFSPGQANNTFGWDDIGFDGPILPRDRGYDVPDNTAHGADAGSVNTGWEWDDAPLSVQTLPVDATSLTHAEGALVEFNWFPYTETVPTISLNGHAPISTAWPFADGQTYSWRTIAIPVPLSEVVQGKNTIRVEQATSSQGSIADFDLILQGAGGVPSCLDPSNCSSTGSSSGSSGPTTPTPRPSTSTPRPSTPSSVSLSLSSVPNAAFTSGPALTSWSRARYDLFGRGTGGALWHRWWNGSRWSGWQSLGGQLAAKSQPAAVAWAPNRIDVFVEGTGAHLWHQAWTGTRWSGWQPLGGILSGSPGVASQAPGRLDVVVPGLNGRIWHQAWTGSRWTGFEALGGATHATPAITAWGPNRLDVFVRGTSGGLWHRSYTGAWSGAWQDLGGSGLTSGPAAASVMAGELDVVVAGPGNVPEHLGYTGSWQHWQAFTSQVRTLRAPALVSLRNGTNEEMCLTDVNGVVRCGSFKAGG